MHESREEELNKKKRNKKMISTQVIRVMLIWMRLGKTKNKEFLMKKSKISFPFHSRVNCFILVVFFIYIYK